MENLHQYLGDGLKQLRQPMAGLSLTAEKTGVSKAMLARLNAASPAPRSRPCGK